MRNKNTTHHSTKTAQNLAFILPKIKKKFHCRLIVRLYLIPGVLKQVPDQRSTGTKPPMTCKKKSPMSKENEKEKKNWMRLEYIFCP